ncbi:MAG TPA: CheR family methyltransferase [Thermoanaerobaculia bacterium]|nr:CheR family methyltransferase [Thermoanaerobaculia bacterium]
MAKKKAAVEDPPAPKTDPFPIVGVGASAGGIEAFLELLRALPQKPGFAMVYILHHDGRTESALAQVVQHATNIPVVRLDGPRDVEIERDRIYVAEGNTNVTIFEGRLRSMRVPKTDGGTSPIDTFLLSLAEEEHGRAIGVILSGSASDGAMGMKMIRSEGGITFAQDETAQFKGMPEAAQEAGGVDYTLRPSNIAAELVRIARSDYFSKVAREAKLPDNDLQKIFSILESSFDVDFTHYKPSTVQRRIQRRMALQRIEALSDYVEFLKANPNEPALLYADILIRVTGFFRDPEVFVALRGIAAELLKGRNEDDPLRIWVPGCASGEEVYSIAMTLMEVMQESNTFSRIQIFGTDLSDAAVDRARFGVYSEAAIADVSPERLNRFFTRFDGGYRIAKPVRECCIFARQNITKDPPFSRLDLISCRNVMIYLGQVLQQRVMGIFHYALRPSGYLLLGTSETIGTFGELFNPVDRKHKIYQKKNGVSRPTLQFQPMLPHERGVRIIPERELAVPSNVFREADRVLLSRYTPPGVLINEDLEILQFRGRTSQFLEPAPGIATFNLLKMAREGLLAELRAAVQAARKTERPIRREGVRIANPRGVTTVTLEVIPFVTQTQERCFIILFDEAAAEDEQPAKKTAGKKKAAKGAKEETEPSRQGARLKRELEATREYLQSIIEEQEAMNEELRSANEEIQSSNEELQSTNEELETAKEELQSSNEELMTLNEELENRNSELAEVNNDLVNLLASVDIPILMLDAGLRIRRFNPSAQKVLNLIPTDAGRSINDLKLSFDLKDLDQLILEVVENLETREIEVSDRNGRWYTLRVRPYKTAEKKIDGAVLVLIDITHLKKP